MIAGWASGKVRGHTANTARALRLGAGVGALVLLTAACQNGKAPSTPAGKGSSAAAQLSVTPADGASNVRPERPVVVSAAAGKLREVQVIGNGVNAEGSLSSDGSRWQSRWPLATATNYQVTATSETGSGGPKTLRSAFTTLKPTQTVHAHATGVQDGSTVGVGMPIMLNFDRPVYNKADVERALEVRTSVPAEGAWRWVGDSQVVYRPRNYWPAGQKVELIGHINGIRAAKDVYGTSDVRLRVTVGDAIISTVNTKNYTMTVRRNGKGERKIPISAGRATKRAYTTTNGVHLTMEKAYKVVADSATVGIPKGDPEYYKLDLYYAVRISNSGEYVHSAPWSVGDQGNRNVSHGCINASPKNAEWFYKLSQPGNVVVVTGTDRELEWDNGWGFWQLSWKQWTSGSALKHTGTAPTAPESPTG